MAVTEAPPTTVQLPDLEPGITLLATTAETGRALHALAVDHVLRSGGSGVWIDPGTHAQTAPLVEIAPSDRILDRLRVARGFTPFQHLQLLRSLPEWLTAESELVVVPALDRYYRDDGLLAQEGKDMVLSAIASLAAACREYDLHALVTRTEADAFSAPLETASSQFLACEITPFGPRFRGDEAETVVYPLEGDWVQTTLSFWAEILAAREQVYGTPSSGRATAEEVGTRGAN